MNLEDAPLPNRVVALRAPDAKLLVQLYNVLAPLFFAILLCAAAYALAFADARDLISDFGMRANARPVPGGQIKGKCRVKLLLASCKVELIAHPAGAPEIRKTVEYSFFETPGNENYQAVVVADPALPDRLSTDIGLEKIWNRLATMLVLGPGMLALALAAMWLFLKAVANVHHKRKVLRALSGQPLRLGFLRLEELDSGIWTVVPHPPGAPGRRTEWRALGSHPAILDPETGLVLAVTAGDGSLAMPLDGDLFFLGLTSEERQELIDWFGLAQPGSPPTGADAPQNPA